MKMPRRLLWWFWSTIVSPKNPMLKIDFMYFVSFTILLIRKGRMREDCISSLSFRWNRFRSKKEIFCSRRQEETKTRAESHLIGSIRFVLFHLIASSSFHGLYLFFSYPLKLEQMILKSGFCARLKLIKSIWNRHPFIQWQEPSSLF